MNQFSLILVCLARLFVATNGAAHSITMPSCMEKSSALDVPVCDAEDHTNIECCQGVTCMASQTICLPLEMSQAMPNGDISVFSFTTKILEGRKVLPFDSREETWRRYSMLEIRNHNHDVYGNCLTLSVQLANSSCLNDRLKFHYELKVGDVTYKTGPKTLFLVPACDDEHPTTCSKKQSPNFDSDIGLEENVTEICKNLSMAEGQLTQIVQDTKDIKSSTQQILDLENSSKDNVQRNTDQLNQLVNDSQKTSDTKNYITLMCVIFMVPILFFKEEIKDFMKKLLPKRSGNRQESTSTPGRHQSASSGSSHTCTSQLVAPREGNHETSSLFLQPEESETEPPSPETSIPMPISNFEI